MRKGVLQEFFPKGDFSIHPPLKVPTTNQSKLPKSIKGNRHIYVLCIEGLVAEVWGTPWQLHCKVSI